MLASPVLIFTSILCFTTSLQRAPPSKEPPASPSSLLAWDCPLPHGHFPGFFFFMLSQLMLWPPSSTFLHVFPPVAACKVLDVSLPWWRLSVTTPGSSTWGFFLGCLRLTLSSAVDSGADSPVNAELGHIPCGRVLWEGIAFSFGI